MTKLEQAIEQYEQDRFFLAAFMEKIGQAEDSKKMMAIIINRLQARFNFVHGIFLLPTEDGLSLTPYSEDTIVPEEFPLGQEVFNRMVSYDGPRIVNIERLIRKPEPHIFFKKRAQQGISCCVTIKLNLNEGKIAVLLLDTGRKTAFDDHLLDLLNLVGHVVAIAFSNIIAKNKTTVADQHLHSNEACSSPDKQQQLIGAGKEMQKILGLIEQVASSGSTVLILGETGTGKELIAEAIHRISPRKDKPMIKINCAALAPNLIESELFGHEKGSFTGASGRRTGKFEQAHNSTLFLDEIGEMPLALQVKLLRALQEKEIERIGGTEVIKVNVRIIAATNLNLQEEVNAGRFRPDLFYRLNVFPIQVPALRHRLEDIPALAAFFTERYAIKLGKNITGITQNVLAAMHTYGWPGNVRELEHMIERSVILTTGNQIREICLPKRHGLQVAGIRLPENEHIKTIEENERDHIIKVMIRCKGKIAGYGGAAELLGIHPSTLNSRIERLGIINPSRHK